MIDIYTADRSGCNCTSPAGSHGS